jgi:hypothetical protein
MNQQPIDISGELRAIHKELALLRENQMFTARAVKALPSDFLQALESIRDKGEKPAGMSRAKRIVLNLSLIIVFCVGIFFLFWAIKPAAAQVPQVAPGWFVTGEWHCGPVRIITSTDGGDGIDFLVIGAWFDNHYTLRRGQLFYNATPCVAVGMPIGGPAPRRGERQ